ncbi:ClpP/crotonase-like domain-containing protein [Baffinella frigidus]|nr:ClpP/crotonase-like domain-containing protein [Cryptophyta sp. CCMP2293]
MLWRGIGSICPRVARGMAVKPGASPVPKPRSFEERMKKLQEEISADKAASDKDGRSEDDSGATASGKAMGGHHATPSGPQITKGTQTLAQRLSQSLRDPLRAKDFLGHVAKGELLIDCHHHSKVLSFKNRKAILSDDAMSNLIEVIQLSDTNWYEKFSILKGGEDNFCTGADPRTIAANLAVDSSSGALKDQLLRVSQAYLLTYLITLSPKQRIAILDGHCIGQGAALALAHTHQANGTSTGRHLRVATNRTVLSFQHAHFMGLFPGNGCSYFLPRMPGNIGLYLALSGVRLNAADCIYSGAASHFVPSHRLGKCLKALAEAVGPRQDNDVMPDQIEAIVASHSLNPDHTSFKSMTGEPSYFTRYSMLELTDPTHLEAEAEAIDRCFGQTSVEDILEALAATDSPWSRRTLANIQQMSPTSLHTTVELFRRGVSCSLEECLRTEWRLAHQLFTRPDFFEGVAPHSEPEKPNPETRNPEPGT